MALRARSSDGKSAEDGYAGAANSRRVFGWFA
jgi:hypothetical protein